MKVVGSAGWIFFLYLLLVAGGCELVDRELPPGADSAIDKLSVYANYSPAKIEITPLTEFALAGDNEKAPQIKVYVSMLDAFDCQVKGPGVFRFELYEYVKRSGEPKGKRINIWPDVDLTDKRENNKHWRDFLRVYEFDLDFEPQSNQDYVLQVMYFGPNGKRLCAEYNLKYTN